MNTLQSNTTLYYRNNQLHVLAGNIAIVKLTHENNSCNISRYRGTTRHLFGVGILEK